MKTNNNPKTIKLLVIVRGAGLATVLLSLIATGSAQAQDASGARGAGPKRPVAVINSNRVITQEELDSSLGAEVYSLEERIYSLRKRALDALVNKIVLEEEAKAKGLSVAELVRQLVSGPVEVSEGQVNAAYMESAPGLAGFSEDEAKERIRLDLETQQRMQRYKSGLQAIRAKARVDWLLPEPEPPTVAISNGDLARGPKDAPVTLVEFSDFQCPYCKQAAAVLRDVLAGSGNKVRLVFKQMPLPMHRDAFGAARASYCAGQQGKFWEYHDKLFSTDDLTVPSLRRIAGALEMDGGAFDKCLESEASKTAVLNDVNEGRRVGVEGTPAFVVNGKMLRGLRTAQEFKDAIGHALAAR